MARMSYDEKTERRQARYYGRRCHYALEAFQLHQGQANHWRELDGADDEHDLTRRWQARADLNEQDAVSYATSAAHHAHLAMSLRAFERHQAADPHCTCNDCIEAFSRASERQGESS